MQSITYYTKEPRAIGRSILRYCRRLLPDRLYVAWLYYMQTGKRLNLKAPRSFSEKLQWLKLYNRRPEYTVMVDKYAVKNYVAKIIGQEYVIPTLGVWDSPEEIDWESLPQQFVLKTTHGGGSKGVVVCTDKEKLDKKVAVRKLKSAMKIDLYKQLVEWPYKNVRRRIIAEQYLEACNDSGNNTGSNDLTDYKFLCFSGVPRLCLVVSDRRRGKYIDFFDNEWNHLPFCCASYQHAPETPEKPLKHKEMLELSAKLSAGHPHVRVDLYEADGKVYFGEFTFFTVSGYNAITPEEWDIKIGSHLQLPS